MKKPETKNQFGKCKSAFYFSLKTLAIFAAFSFVLTSCCKDDETPAVTEKFVVMFGVDSGEGDLKAFIGEKSLVSPVEVEKGKKVLFKATHSKSWTIQYWKINGEIIRSIEPEQTFEINKHYEVRIAFKRWDE